MNLQAQYDLDVARDALEDRLDDKVTPYALKEDIQKARKERARRHA